MKNLGSLKNLKKSANVKTFLKYWWLWCLIMLTVFSYWSRALPAKYGELGGLDEFNIYRMSEYILTHNLQILPHDYLRYWPDGVSYTQYGSLLTYYVPVIMYIIFVFFGLSMPFLSFALIYPAITGALSVFVMFWLGLEIFNDKKAGLFSALFLASATPYLSRSIGGSFEKEATGGIFILLAVFFFVKSYKKGSWQWGLLGGLTLGVALNTWGGAMFVLYFVSLFLLALLLLNRYDKRMLISSVTFLLPAVLITQMIAGFDRVPIDQFFTLVVVTLIIIRFAAERFKLVKKEQLTYLPLGIFILLALSVLIGSMFSDYLWGIVSTGMNLIGMRQSVIGTTVAEQMPGDWNYIVSGFSISYAHAVIPFAEPFEAFFSLWFLMILGLMLLLYMLYKKRDWLLMLPIVWLVLSIPTVFFMVRLAFFLAPPAALVSGYLIAELLNRFSQTKYIKGKKGVERINLYTIPVVAILTLMIASHLAMAYVFCNSVGPIFNEYWGEAMNYMSEQTPENSSILSWWDFGYWFQTRGHRPSIADGGNINGTVDEQIADWFVSPAANWTGWRWWMKAKKVDYILMDYTLPGKYGAISKIASRGKTISGMLQFQQSSVYPQQNKTIIEYKSGEYVVWLPISSDGNIAGAPIFMISREGQYFGRSYVNDLCTKAGIIRLETQEGENTMPGCITISSLGLYYVPPEAEFTVFTNLMFMDGYGNPDVKKVFDNQLIKIYKLEINESVS